MTPRQIELARHALGLTQQRQSYRNHFVAGPGHSDYEDWSSLVAAGLATVRRGDTKTGKILYGGDDCFFLTKTAAATVLRRGETLDPEDFPATSD